MRQLLLMPLVPFLVLAQPTWPPPLPPDPPGDHRPVAERVILDATLPVSAPSAEGSCAEMEAGRVTAAIRLASDVEPRRAEFMFYGSRDADRPTDIKLTVSPRDEARGSAVLTSGLYCWILQGEAAPDADRRDHAEPGASGQRATIRLTHRPE